MTRRAAARAVATCALLAVLGGCALWPFGGSDDGISQEELRDRLLGYAADFSDTCAQAADAIVAASSDREVQRAAVRWKIGATDAVRESLRIEPATAAFVDMWTLASQMRQLFEGDDARRTFGEHVAFAQEAARVLEVRIEEIGHRVLDDEQWSDARDAVTGFASEHPIEHLAGRAANRPSPQEPGFGKRFEAIVNLPLAPFRAVQGIDEGAQAVRDFATVADRFTSVVAALPERSVWQLELLLYDIEQRATMTESLAALDRISRSADRISTTADTLPEELRAAVQDVLAALEAHEARLLALAEETRALLGDASGAMGEATTLAGAWQGTARDVAEAGRAWEAMANAFGIPQAREEKAAGAAQDDEGGFDVAEYGAAARDVTEAASRLRELVADIEGLAGDEALGSTAQDALASTRAEAVALTDHVTKRAIQLVGVVLVAALAFRWLGPRGGRSARDAAAG